MNNVAIITGASGGLGSVLTKALLDAGWYVIAGARTPSKADILVQLKEKYNQQLHIVTTDVTKKNHLQQLQQKAHAIGSLKLLINNAGTANGKALETATLEEFEEVFRVNVSSAFELTKLVLPDLKKHGGTVVNISSIVGSVPLPYLGIYSASKHALNAITIAMHLEQLDSNVRFILVEPGPLTSRLCGDAIADTNQDLYTKAQASMQDGVRRIGKQHGVPTDKAATIIIQALQKSKKFQRVTIGTWTKMILILAKVLPSVVFQRILAWLYRIKLRR